jgi:hypothetical protein
MFPDMTSNVQFEIYHSEEGHIKVLQLDGWRAHPCHQQSSVIRFSDLVVKI